MMNYIPDPKDADATAQSSKEDKSAAETKQEQSDPNLTELRGLVDPDEDLEPKGTDNNFDE